MIGRNLAALTIILSLTIGAQAHGGLLSSLAKIGKKAEAPESSLLKLDDLNLKALNLPEPENISLVRAKLDANRQWVFTDTSNNLVNNVGDFSNPVIYIDKAHFPRDFSTLSTLPLKHRLLLRDGNDVFELDRTNGVALKIGNAKLNFANASQLKEALWQLQRPWSNGPIRVLGYSKKPENSLTLPKGVAVRILVDSPEQLRKQTIVITGPIRDGSISVAGRSIPLKQLARQGDEFDISYVILETANKSSPSRMVNTLDKLGAFSGELKTGEFLNLIQPKGNKAHYSVAPSGNHQVLISRLPESSQNARDGNASVTIHESSSSAILHAAILIRPKQERQEELDRELIPGVPFELIVMYIVFAMPGLWAWAECSWVMDKIWPHPRSANPTATQHLLSIVRFLLMLFVLVPMIGTFAAAFKIIYMIWQATQYVTLKIWALLCWLAQPF